MSRETHQGFVSDPGLVSIYLSYYVINAIVKTYFKSVDYTPIGKAVGIVGQYKSENCKVIRKNIKFNKSKVLEGISNIMKVEPITTSCLNTKQQFCKEGHKICSGSHAEFEVNNYSKWNHHSAEGIITSVEGI